jgi:L-cysteine desulfidase
MSYTVKDILQIQVAPALGCTEPAAVALAAAAAASVLPGQDIDSVEVWLDPNVYKNGLAAAIPGTPGLTGLDTAAALGAMGGDPALKLEVLEPLNDKIIDRAVRFVRDGKAKVNLLADKQGLYVQCRVTAGNDRAEAIIEGMHDRVVSISLNDQPVSDHPLLAGVDSSGPDGRSDLEAWLKTLSVSRLLEFVDDLDKDDLAFLEEGIKVNMRLAEDGLKHGRGLGVGRTLERLARQQLIQRDMIMAARMITSAAADARMAGVKLPAMSSAGSGNHGLTAVLPIVAVKDFVDSDHQTLLEAVGLSHIITAYVKSYTGRLSAVCGCSIAAGAGAAAGITYLLGGDVRHVAGAITNLVEDLAGVICDGAKGSCALKLATAAGTSVQASLFALQGITVQSTDGIIGASVEQTTQNIGAISTQGMIETDRTILKIMIEKKFTAV